MLAYLVLLIGKKLLHDKLVIDVVVLASRFLLLLHLFLYITREDGPAALVETFGEIGVELTTALEFIAVDVLNPDDISNFWNMRHRLLVVTEEVEVGVRARVRRVAVCLIADKLGRIIVFQNLRGLDV